MDRRPYYLDQYPTWPRGDFERVDWYLYHRKTYDGMERLFFFNSYLPGGEEETNLYMPGQLPSPQSFLVTGIKIMGITGPLLDGTFHFQIGNKIYQDAPTWLFTLREHQSRRVPLVIGPGVNFSAQIRWNGRYLPSFWRKQIMPDITVVLCGIMERPIQ